MKLTTKRNRWFFWRELFSYMIPMILIAGSLDVFTSFMVCPLHPEWSAPCSVNWIIAAIYGIFLILTIILEIISARMLRKIKKQIENEFLDVANNSNFGKKEIKKVKSKKLLAKTDKSEKKEKIADKKNVSTKKKTSKNSI